MAKINYKKIINYFFLLFFIIDVSSFSIIAEEDLYSEGDIQYRIIDDAVVIVKYNGEDNEVKIPLLFGVYEVKGIEAGAFLNTSVEKIILGDGIVNIESGAFNDGINIEVVDINGNILDKYEYKNQSQLPKENIEKKDEPTSIITEGHDTMVEDVDIDISEDIEAEIDAEANEEEKNIVETIEEKQEKDKIRNRKFQLFDASKFISNFKKNPIGYILITVSLFLVIFVMIRYVINRK